MSLPGRGNCFWKLVRTHTNFPCALAHFARASVQSNSPGSRGCRRRGTHFAPDSMSTAPETIDHLLEHDDDETTAGNYFVANYPPFHFWDANTARHVGELIQKP